MGVCCPLCRYPVEPVMEREKDGLYRFRLKERTDPINFLRQALLAYWRWKAEGERPERSSFRPEPKQQFYYDNYHEHIEYDPETDRYRFSIQTYDSPDGDTWWRGSFKLHGLTEIIDVQEDRR